MLLFIYRHRVRCRLLLLYSVIMHSMLEFFGQDTQKIYEKVKGLFIIWTVEVFRLEKTRKPPNNLCNFKKSTHAIIKTRVLKERTKTQKIKYGVFEISKVLVSPRNSHHYTSVSDKNSTPKSSQNEMRKQKQNEQR